MYNGYEFYFKDGEDVLTFPITPSKLSIEVGSNNKTVNLINEGEINILKSPSLTEVSFDARFPMRQYPYARKFAKFDTYWKKFKELKEKKKSFRFIVARKTPKGSRTWDTNLLVALEDMKLKEAVDEGDDVIISFTLKQFKSYGVKKIKLPQVEQGETIVVSKPAITPRDGDDKTKSSKKYTVKDGDCLWTIAKKFYDDGSKWTIIYKANETVIENECKKRGLSCSMNGHWIFTGTVLTIPAL